MKEQNRRLKSLALSDSGFIFDPGTGQTFTTNETGLDIIRLLKEGKTVEEILMFIEEQYDGERDVIYKDTTQFLAQMKTYRLIDDM